MEIQRELGEKGGLQPLEPGVKLRLDRPTNTKPAGGKAKLSCLSCLTNEKKIVEVRKKEICQEK